MVSKINIPKDMLTGVEHNTNQYGKLEIIDYKSAGNVTVRFVDTGYLTTASSWNIRNGQVKDKIKPSAYGVGYLGDGQYKASENGKDTKVYSRWIGMLDRCYGVKWKENNPCYLGCSVCEEWLNFQNFAQWFFENYPKDGNDYELDKDIKIPGNKVYGPDTCKFVTHSENASHARSKRYKLLSPEGKEIVVFNLMAFCRENNLRYSSMLKVSNGSRESCFGWKVIDKGDHL